MKKTRSKTSRDTVPFKKPGNFYLGAATIGLFIGQTCWLGIRKSCSQTVRTNRRHLKINSIITCSSPGRDNQRRCGKIECDPQNDPSYRIYMRCHSKKELMKGASRRSPWLPLNSLAGQFKGQQPPVKVSFWDKNSVSQKKRQPFERKGRLFSCKNGFSASLANGGVLIVWTLKRHWATFYWNLLHICTFCAVLLLLTVHISTGFHQWWQNIFSALNNRSFVAAFQKGDFSANLSPLINAFNPPLTSHLPLQHEW